MLFSLAAKALKKAPKGGKAEGGGKEEQVVEAADEEAAPPKTKAKKRTEAPAEKDVDQTQTDKVRTSLVFGGWGEGSSKPSVHNPSLRDFLFGGRRLRHRSPGTKRSCSRH